MKIDSAMMVDAFKFLADYGFHIEGRADSEWPGSYVGFQRGRIALAIDFDTITLDSWLDLYDEKGENIAKIGVNEALAHTRGLKLPKSWAGDYAHGLEELVSAVKSALMPVLCSERAFWQLHGRVYKK